MDNSLLAFNDAVNTSETDERRHVADHLLPTPQLLSEIRALAEHTLGFSPIEDDDDLFDFGCDSVLCLTLLLEIEHVTGRSLTPSEFYDAPTIRGLAEAVQAKCKQRPSTLVLLKGGSDSLPPLILLPGLGSTVTQVRPLADLLDVANTIYGIEPYGLYTDEEPHDTIEALAQQIVDDIACVVSAGQHVHLLGVCFGGLLAFEIACQLEGSDGSSTAPKLGALILVNSYPHSRYWSLSDRAITWFRVVRNLSPSAILRAVKAGRGVDRHLGVWSKCRQLALNAMRLPTSIFALSAYSRADEKWPGGKLPQTLPAGLSRVKAASTIAFQKYAPGHLNAKTLLITLPSLGRLPFNAARYWRKHVQPLQITLLSEQHADIFGVNLQSLATCAATYLHDGLA